MDFIHSNDTKHIFQKSKLDVQQCLTGRKNTQGTQRDRHCVVSCARNLSPLIPQRLQVEINSRVLERKQGGQRGWTGMGQSRTMQKL